MVITVSSAASPAPPGVDPAVADVTERLMAEFEDRLDLATISRVVSAARHDLRTVPPGSVPEMVERLARQRLLDQTVGHAPVPTPRDTC